MIRTLSLILIMLFVKFAGYSSNIDKVRILYQHSVTSKDSCLKLLNILKNYNESNNSLLAGYKACGKMILARHVYNPISKYSNFCNGRELLEKCISKDKLNPELRFLRFSIQTNVPRFLRYNNAIETDKTFLLSSIAGIKDKRLKSIITRYLKKSPELNFTDKQQLVYNQIE